MMDILLLCKGTPPVCCIDTVIYVQSLLVYKYSIHVHALSKKSHRKVQQNVMQISNRKSLYYLHDTIDPLFRHIPKTVSSTVHLALYTTCYFVTMNSSLM